MSDRAYFTIVIGLFLLWSGTGLYNNGWQIGVFGPGLAMGIVFVIAMTLARIYATEDQTADTFGAPPRDWKHRTRDALRPIAKHWRWAVTGGAIWLAYLVMDALNWDIGLAISILIVLAILLIPQFLGDWIMQTVSAKLDRSETGRRVKLGCLWIILIVAILATAMAAWDQFG